MSKQYYRLPLTLQFRTWVGGMGNSRDDGLIDFAQRYRALRVDGRYLVHPSEVLHQPIDVVPAINLQPQFASDTAWNWLIHIPLTAADQMIFQAEDDAIAGRMVTENSLEHPLVHAGIACGVEWGSPQAMTTEAQLQTTGDDLARRQMVDTRAMAAFGSVFRRMGKVAPDMGDPRFAYYHWLNGRFVDCLTVTKEQVTPNGRRSTTREAPAPEETVASK